MKMLKIQNKKHGAIFLLLLITTATFLLWVMKWQVLNTRLTICLTREGTPTKNPPNPKTIEPPFTTQTTRATPEPQFEARSCSFKYLSPENTVEGRKLLDSITWPDTAPVPKPFSLNKTTSAAKSTFTIVPGVGGYHVGDELTVRIQVNDYHGNPKKGGGDFIISKLSNQQLGAGVVGQVQDHLNGTFTAVFPLLWDGTAQVEVTLVHTSESISVLKRLNEEQPDRIYFKSDFRSGSVTETVKCNVCLNLTIAPVCNHTDLITGEHWFCVRPKRLSCEDRVSHVIGGYNQRISKQEETLFQRGVNLKALIKAKGTSSVMVLPGAKQTGWTEETTNSQGSGFAGFYHNDQWRPQVGATVQQFNNASDMNQCLKGKTLHLYGDSTIRQFFEYIMKALPDLKKFDLHSSPQSGPFLALDFSRNIMVTYSCHAPPIRFAKIPVSQLRSVANELERVTGGPNTVVVIGVWSHFSTFPMEVYYQRLVTIRKAIQRLKNRAPGTKVIIRTANMKELTLYESLTNSDWYSYQRDKVLRAVFKDMDVLLLEAWEMVQAHRLPHSLHPQPEIIKIMINAVLSYTCPI